MKILAKKGSALELLLKQMNEQLLREREEAMTMVEEYCGIRPDSIGYGWVFGYTAEWNYDLIAFNDANLTPEKLIINKEHKVARIFKINKKIKGAKDFVEKWRKRFKGINGDVLSKYGIPVMDEKTGIYCSWLPLKDEEGYYISVGSSLLDRMPKVKNPQFEIK